MNNSFTREQRRYELEIVLHTPEQYRTAVNHAAKWRRWDEARTAKYPGLTEAILEVNTWLKSGPKLQTPLEALATWNKAHPDAKVQLTIGRHDETTVTVNARQADMDDVLSQRFVRSSDAHSPARSEQHYMPVGGWSMDSQ